MIENPQPLFMPGASVRVVHSPFDGARYRIFVAVPNQPPPERGYPAVFLLDANATFMSTVESLRMRARRPASTGITPAVVIGIGYDTVDVYDADRRKYDFTRAVPDAGSSTTSSAGGAHIFTQLIDEIIRPLAAREVPLDPARQTLIGHSLGGCYVLARLVENPVAFESYIAISPSIWSDEQWLLDHTRTIACRLPEGIPPRRVLITIGEFEQSLAPWQAHLPDPERIVVMRRARAMRDRAFGFARCLYERSAQQLIVRFEELPNEDHSSSAMTGISHGLRFALWAGAAELCNMQAPSE